MCNPKLLRIHPTRLGSPPLRDLRLHSSKNLIQLKEVDGLSKDRPGLLRRCQRWAMFHQWILSHFR